ncbi:MAG: DUF3127 domain-containing protein [Myxococcales bacterium]|nr:DUF3127 domain-containing protein [Myxococcales bacterium]
MGYQATGRLLKKFDTNQISDRFRKREFVLELADGKYPQTVMFQLTGDRCEQLDSYEEGQTVEVEFSLRGREWTSPKGEVKYFNTLDVWQVSGPQKGAGGRDEEPLPEFMESMDDVPF